MSLGLGSFTPRLRTGIQIGMLGALFRLLQAHLRLRAVNSCGSLLGQRLRTGGVVSRLSFIAIG
jgi:hypothetical protein